MNQVIIPYNEQYQFGFTLHNIRALAHNNQHISCSIRRTDHPQAAWTWEDILWQGMAVEFSITFSDAVNIKGNLALYHRENGNSCIAMQALYGPGYTERFEGVLVEIHNAAQTEDKV